MTRTANPFPTHAAPLGLDAYGVEVDRGFPYCPPANQVFGPEELEARIAAHAARVEADLARLPQLIRGGGRKPNHSKPAGGLLARLGRSSRVLADGRTPPDLRTAHCCGCGAVLLAETEVVRRDVCRRLSIRRAAAPIVAGRCAEGRPYCEACLPTGEDVA